MAYCGWTKPVSRHFETMGSIVRWDLQGGRIIPLGFLGGAKWISQQSTVLLAHQGAQVGSEGSERVRYPTGRHSAGCGMFGGSVPVFLFLVPVVCEGNQRKTAAITPVLAGFSGRPKEN